MLDVERQLREYFEEVVERVTAEDVRVRVSTERGVRIPERRLLRLRPLAAGAIGFGVALTLLGLVLVTDRLFAADVGDATGGPTGLLEPGTGSSPWLIIPVAIGLATLIAGAIYMRHTQLESRGGKDMQTMEQIDTGATEAGDNEKQMLKRRSRFLGWLSGLLVLAVLGLGAWLVAEVSSDSGASLPSEVRTAVDNYAAAWANTDADAFLEATTADYTFMGKRATGQFAEFTVAQREGTLRSLSYWRAETLVETASGDGPYYVGRTERVYTSAQSDGFEGQSILTVEEVDGTWKVSQHTWIGDL